MCVWNYLKINCSVCVCVDVFLIDLAQVNKIHQTLDTQIVRAGYRLRDYNTSTLKGTSIPVEYFIRYP